MIRFVWIVLATTFIAPAPRPRGGDESEFVKRYHDRGEEAVRAGKLDEAEELFRRTLEREPHHLPTLVALARLDKGRGRLDDALDWAGRFLEIWRHLDDRPAEHANDQRELYAFVHEADPLRPRLDALRRDYVGRLLKLAGEQMDHLAWHSARAMLLEAGATDPEHPDLAAGLARIRKEGGNELAVGDETGGADPLQGVTAEWVAKNDPLHAEWGTAWELSTEHYKVKTDAGYRVLKTVARAMEQVQVFYRQFHQYKTKGEAIPIANVLIYKNHDEYMAIGHPPMEWAGGHWDGTSVHTYDSRGNGESGLAGVLDTLFHEASHQFTTLCGGSSVPAWLNEGMASFFEGTRLLSNGKLDWNLVAPGRLYPLVEDLRGTSPHKLADVIQGHVEDYRVYYPWGWGIVYYLYNAEDENGKLLYRPLLREYFQDYHKDKHLERFVEFFVTRSKVPGVATIEDFEKRFRQYALDLEAQDKGQLDAARILEERADRAGRQKDLARAIELYGRSLERDPDHPEVLWKLAGVLEKAGEGDRAAGVLRQWLSVTAPDTQSSAPDPFAGRRVQALARIPRLDTSARRLADLRGRFHADSIALAREYDQKSMPRMALGCLRGPATAQPPDATARELYFAISDKSGVSLESWRLLFDERTLKGFYGGGETDFTVENGAIVAHISEGADNASAPEIPTTGEGAKAAPRATSFAFQRLFVDAQPSGDWSLEAEIKLGPGATLAGLCFGKKADGVFHGLGLLPKGYIDLARIGTNAKTLLRQAVKLEGQWHRLRADVAGTRLVVTLDGKPAVEYEFESRAELRGDFGLLAGLGTASFREIRLLEYDASLPRRARIGHRRAAADLDAPPDAPLARAAPGKASYTNQAPPLLSVEGWIGDAPGHGDLERMRQWPAILVFWTTYQESQKPVLPALLPLAEKYKDLGLPILLVSNEKRETIEAWTADHPVPFPIAYDWSQRTYQDYDLQDVGLPHAKVLGLDGRVVWEGNPDYDAQFGSYLDEPVADLVKKGRLAELAAAKTKLVAAEDAEKRGELAAACAGFLSVSKLDVDHPIVGAAKAGVGRMEAESTRRIEAAQALAKDGRLLQCAHGLEEVVSAFAGLSGADAASRALEKRAAEAAFQSARKLENRMHLAEQHLAAGALAKALASLEVTAQKLEPGSDPWLRERTSFLLEACKSGADAKAVLESYRARFPGAAP